MRERHLDSTGLKPLQVALVQQLAASPKPAVAAVTMSAVTGLQLVGLQTSKLWVSSSPQRVAQPSLVLWLPVSWLSCTKAPRPEHAALRWHEQQVACRRAGVSVRGSPSCNPRYWAAHRGCVACRCGAERLCRPGPVTICNTGRWRLESGACV